MGLSNKLPTILYITEKVGGNEGFNSDHTDLAGAGQTPNIYYIEHILKLLKNA
jgi:hypothetical protein